MKYETKNFEHLLGLKGFSDNALKTHFTLYQGYVNNTNKLNEKLMAMTKENKTAEPEFAELKRRFAWEFNGMKLHEYYFEAMTKKATELSKNSALYRKITDDFGSFESFEKNFKSTAAMRGIGWAILYFDREANKLFNVWINEHDLGHLGNATLLLNIDVFEHAFMLDYGTKRADYIDAFMKVIDWHAVENRFSKAVILQE